MEERKSRGGEGEEKQWFARIDSQIRANHLILANRLGVPELNPFLRIGLQGAKNCESQF